MASTTVLAEGGDTSLMTLFLKNILNLGLGSAGGSAASPGPTPAEPNTRTCDKNIIRAFIDVKVKELKPFLQDDEYMEEEGAEGAEGGDTAIVQPAGEQQQQQQQQTLRQRPHKEIVRRYSRLRKRIHRALLRETVSNSTIDLIIHTIDEMIANMVAGRCERGGERGGGRGGERGGERGGGRGGERGGERGGGRGGERGGGRGGERGGERGGGQRSAPRPPAPEEHTEEVAARPAAWRLEWQKIREKYSDLFRGNESVPQERLNEIVGSLMEKLPSFFANVVREGEALAEGYGIRCERLRVGRAGPEVEAEVEVEAEAEAEAEADGRCGEALGVCSGELRRFLVRLFKAVNESSARVLQDYLEMYKVDVNIDRVLGRRGILDTLRDINREAEAEVCKIYAKKIQSLVINEGKKRGLRAAHLTDLIKNITENVKMHTNQIIRVQMEPIDTELKERILKDLDDNMRVELDRLARDLEHTICSAFATCNGRYTVRRAGAGGGGGGAGGGRGVFVRVQLQLEERPARAPRRTASALRHSGNYTRPIQIKYSTFDRKIYDMKLLNVTRTTRFYSQNSNTKITQ